MFNYWSPASRKRRTIGRFGTVYFTTASQRPSGPLSRFGTEPPPIYDVTGSFCFIEAAQDVEPGSYLTCQGQVCQKII